MKDLTIILTSLSLTPLLGGRMGKPSSFDSSSHGTLLSKGPAMTPALAWSAAVGLSVRPLFYHNTTKTHWMIHPGMSPMHAKHHFQCD
jgi:hypothetical protein